MIAAASRHFGATTTSALLHAAVVLAALPALPPRQPWLTERAFEVTLELPTPPIQEPTAAAPDRATLKTRPGDASPQQSAPTPGPVDAAAAPTPVPVEPDVALTAPSSEPPPLSARDFGNSAPAPAPEPRLEKVAPAVQTPSSVTGREFAKTAPPAAPASPSVQDSRQAPPAPQPIQQATPQRATKQQTVERADGTARGVPLPTSRAPNQQSDHPAQQDYLWQIIRKLSQARFRPQSPQQSEQGFVVARLTIAPDGRLVDVGLTRSSGFPQLDRAVVDTIRRASPFAPLPGELGAEPHNFIVPLSYLQDR
jgi:periplasmic protein TonB